MNPVPVRRDSIFLSYRKTNSTHSRCTFPGCPTPTDRLRLISRSTRFKAIKRKKLCIPEGARACHQHSNDTNWDMSSINFGQFNQKQIEDMISLLAKPPVETLQNRVIGPDNKTTMEVYIGLNDDQFERLLNVVKPHLIQLFRDENKSRESLYIYLMKLRTDQTYAQMAPHFNISIETVGSRVRQVRKVIHQHFVPLHLFARREEIIQHTTPLSRKLFQVRDDAAILILDGTYIFTIKSSNYIFQKETYSSQKSRNLLKIMMCVAPDGFIVATYGPFSAKKNDATIIEELMNHPNSIFNYLQPGGLVIVDRGFRDVINKLKRRNFQVEIPQFISRNKSQLTTKEANLSRLVTKLRYIVEVRNGHVKSKYRFMDGVKNVESLPYLAKDYEICASLLNAFGSSIHSDKHDWSLIGDTMLAQLNVKNILANLVSKIPRSSFTRTTNLTLTPKLSMNDLKIITQGTYQISQSKSYCQLHMFANNNNFVLEVCGAQECRKYCESLVTPTHDPLLLLVNMKSRFVSSKSHKAYTLVDLNGTGSDVLIAYCCSCKNGLRTIGCCSHVTTILWYVYHIDITNIKFPSTNLNNILLNTASATDSDSIIESDIE